MRIQKFITRVNMSKKYICGSEKYQIDGPDMDSIGLSVSIDGLPKALIFNDKKLFLKTSFHVTLFAIGKAIQRYNIAIPNFLAITTENFCEFTKEKNVELVRYRNEFRYCVEDNLQSIVVMCDVGNLDTFFQIINRKYGLKIEYPPTHVTLYSLPLNTGIFLTNSEDIKNLTKPIEIPSLAASFRF